MPLVSIILTVARVKPYQRLRHGPTAARQQGREVEVQGLAPAKQPQGKEGLRTSCCWRGGGAAFWGVKFKHCGFVVLGGPLWGLRFRFVAFGVLGLRLSGFCCSGLGLGMGCQAL